MWVKSYNLQYPPRKKTVLQFKRNKLKGGEGLNIHPEKGIRRSASPKYYKVIFFRGEIQTNLISIMEVRVPRIGIRAFYAKKAAVCSVRKGSPSDERTSPPLTPMDPVPSIVPDMEKTDAVNI